MSWLLTCLLTFEVVKVGGMTEEAVVNSVK